jgi:hypothetical protein
VEGIEPPSSVLETEVMPLYDTGNKVRNGWIRVTTKGVRSDVPFRIDPLRPDVPARDMGATPSVYLTPHQREAFGHVPIGAAGTELWSGRQESNLPKTDLQSVA